MARNTVEIILAARDQASRATQQAFRTIQGSAKVALGAVRTAAVAATGAITTMSGIIGTMGINYNAMMEQSEVAWATLLGDAKSAQDMLKQISDFTKATPFETESVDMMAKYMHNAGLEGKELFEELLKVSDVASAFAIPAAEAKEMTRQMSQVRQAGVAYTEDLNILQDRGVPIFKAIAEQQGIMVKDVKQMASEGKLSADIYIDAFNSIAKGVEGASEDQSKTFNGMLSTLKDNIKIFSGELSKGVFEQLKGYLPVVIDTVERMSEAFKNGGWKGIMDEFLPPNIVDSITTGFQVIQDVFNQVKDTIVSNKDQIIGVFEFYIAYWTGWFEFVKSLFTGEGNIGESFIRIFETIKSVATPILEDAFSFIRGLLSQLEEFWKENGEQITQAVKNVFSFIASIIEFIMPLVKWIIEDTWAAIKNVFSGALNMIMGIVQVFTGLFTGDWSKMWEGIKQLFAGAVEFLWGIVQLGFMGKIFKVLKSFGSKAIEVIMNMVGGIKGKFDDIVSAAKSKFESIRDAIMNPIREAKETVMGFIDNIKSAFSNFTTNIKLPHFNISNFSLNPIDWATNGLPRLSVDWYDKGGVFYGPQVIGVGEKRPEFVGALDDLRKIVREETGGVGGNTYNVTVNARDVDMDENRLIRTLQRWEKLYE